MPISERGREKLQSSPDNGIASSDKKKRGSIFRRASLSRKKNKEEVSKRPKSRERNLADAVDMCPKTPEDSKKKSSSLPRETKSSFMRDRKSKRESGRRKTLDLDSKSESVKFISLKESVARSSCEKLALPEIVGTTIKEIEKRGICEKEIYRVPAPKIDVMKILKMYEEMDVFDLSKIDIHIVAASLKIFVGKLQENLLDCMHDQLEDLVKDQDTFVEKTKILIESKIFPSENYNICSWLFTHLMNIVQSAQNSQSIDSLSPIWVPNLKISKPLFTNMVNFAQDLFGKIDLNPGRTIIRWKDSSTNLALPESVTLEWLKEETDCQEKILSKLHSLENPDSHSEERMWEVQRIKTALKRKQKQIRKEQQEKDAEEMENLLLEERKALIAQEELIKMQNHLRKKLELEKAKLEVLRAQEPVDQVSSHESEGEDELDREQLRELCDQLVQENERLEKENEKIIENINEERQLLVEANIAYRVKNEIQNRA